MGWLAMYSLASPLAVFQHVARQHRPLDISVQLLEGAQQDSAADLQMHSEDLWALVWQQMAES